MLIHITETPTHSESRSKVRKKGIWSSILTLMTALATMASSTICGQQDYLHQWSSLVDVTFQMSAVGTNSIAVAAMTSKASRLNALAAEENGALLMLYKAQSGTEQDPEVATLLTKIDLHSVISFKALTVMTPSSSTSDTAVAVMETSHP